MRAVVQRVKSASVTVSGELISEIGTGLLIFLGISKSDQREDINYLTQKVAHLRIFRDKEGKMNKSLLDIEGSALIVSQFTLYGDCRKGRRPSFIEASPPEKANELYEEFIYMLNELGVNGKGGKFQAMMDVQLINDGPVTMLLDSSKLF